MRTMNFSELNEICQKLKTYVGWSAQDLQHEDNSLVLRLFGPDDHSQNFVYMDLNPQCPLVLPLASVPKKIQKSKTPLTLFFNAHFKSGVLASVEVEEGLGRVLRLNFEVEDKDDHTAVVATMEVRVIPRAANLILKTGRKQISLHRVMDLVPSQFSHQPGRSLQQLTTEWLAKQSAGPTTSEVQPEQKAEKKRRDLIKSLEKLRVDLQRRETLPYQSLGEWLVENQSLEVPKQWRELVDARRSLSWNIEKSFALAKQNKHKIAAQMARERELLAQLDNLAENQVTKSAPIAKEKSFLNQAKVKGRSLLLDETDQLMAFKGKSGADNLQILRRSNAWDYWLHLKDAPGAHAVIRRNKNRIVSDDVLRKVARWLASEGTKEKFLPGEKVQFLVAEVRFVKPVKGDRLGRVTYRNERTLTVQIS